MPQERKSNVQQIKTDFIQPFNETAEREKGLLNKR